MPASPTHGGHRRENQLLGRAAARAAAGVSACGTRVRDGARYERHEAVLGQVNGAIRPERTGGVSGRPAVHNLHGRSYSSMR